MYDEPCMMALRSQPHLAETSLQRGRTLISHAAILTFTFSGVITALSIFYSKPTVLNNKKKLLS